ncbi:MAG: rhomboid family intramembrane serine protease [Polyangiaceae bacterium]|nr:rhomboid family intramembrane serine protease [Polyangiaceae bacterium]
MAPSSQFQFPRPGPVMKWTLISLFAIWLIYALGLNWFGMPAQWFEIFTAQPADILHGELWRLFTASLLQEPRHTVSPIIFALLGIYFLGCSLEESWGGKRFLYFMVLSGALSYLVQAIFAVVIPGAISARLTTAPYFGTMPVVSAIAVAWALSFRGQTVRLFFALPVSSTLLLWFVIGATVLGAIADEQSYAGRIALFSGLGWGYLLGGSQPSPLRKLYLQLRLKQLEREVSREKNYRKKKLKKSGLQVVSGGKDDDSKPGKTLN